MSMQVSSTTLLGALLALTLLFLFPLTASAQSDAIRVMAGQVLAEKVLGRTPYPTGSDANRDGGIWRDDRRDDDRRDDGRYENRRVYDRRDAKQVRKEQKAREQFCRKNPRERVCREWFGTGYGVNDRRANNAAWCWDRNRDGRCDVNNDNRRVPGRGVAVGRR
jgi:hypothetical protein